MLFFHSYYTTFEIPRALETYRTLQCTFTKTNSGRVVFFGCTIKSGQADKENSFTAFDSLGPNKWEISSRQQNKN